jgi:hypothetical protein
MVKRSAQTQLLYRRRAAISERVTARETAGIFGAARKLLAKAAGFLVKGVLRGTI